MDGQVEWHMLAHRCSLEQRELNWEQVLAAEARAGPSRRVSMCVWIMSEWTVAIVVASSASDSPEMQIIVTYK